MYPVSLVMIEVIVLEGVSPMIECDSERVDVYLRLTHELFGVDVL